MSKRGWAKIKYCCRQARSEGIHWAWVDTCCIDKTSSTVLSEAINSMYRWYANSAVCYVYLEDVHLANPQLAEPAELFVWRGYANWMGAAPITRYRLRQETEHSDSDVNRFKQVMLEQKSKYRSWLRRFNEHVGARQDYLGQFHNSRWFRRGWTLQELLAPQRVEFFNQRWSFLGTKAQVQARLARITGIEEKYLVGDVPFSAVPAGLIFSWASKRDTSRPEDMAYCLLGFFDVSLPLLYGEGKNALIRLQEEIIRRNDDYSLFLWRRWSDDRGRDWYDDPEPALASSLHDFNPHNTMFITDGLPTDGLPTDWGRAWNTNQRSDRRRPPEPPGVFEDLDWNRVIFLRRHQSMVVERRGILVHMQSNALWLKDSNRRMRYAFTNCLYQVNGQECPIYILLEEQNLQRYTGGSQYYENCAKYAGPFCIRKTVDTGRDLEDSYEEPPNYMYASNGYKSPRDAQADLKSTLHLAFRDSQSSIHPRRHFSWEGKYPDKPDPYRLLGVAIWTPEREKYQKKEWDPITKLDVFNLGFNHILNHIPIEEFEGWSPILLQDEVRGVTAKVLRESLSTFRPYTSAIAVFVLRTWTLSDPNMERYYYFGLGIVGPRDRWWCSLEETTPYPATQSDMDRVMSLFRMKYASQFMAATHDLRDQIRVRLSDGEVLSVWARAYPDEEGGRYSRYDPNRLIVQAEIIRLESGRPGYFSLACGSDYVELDCNCAEGLCYSCARNPLPVRIGERARAKPADSDPPTRRPSHQLADTIRCWWALVTLHLLPRLRAHRSSSTASHLETKTIYDWKGYWESQDDIEEHHLEPGWFTSRDLERLQESDGRIREPPHNADSADQLVRRAVDNQFDGWDDASKYEARLISYRILTTLLPEMEDGSSWSTWDDDRYTELYQRLRECKRDHDGYICVAPDPSHWTESDHSWKFRDIEGEGKTYIYPTCLSSPEHQYVIPKDHKGQAVVKYLVLWTLVEVAKDRMKLGFKQAWHHPQTWLPEHALNPHLAVPRTPGEKRSIQPVGLIHLNGVKQYSSIYKNHRLFKDFW